MKKSILETLIDEKTKVRKILKGQLDSLNHTDNNYLFGLNFESEFSKLKKVNFDSGAGSSRSPNYISPQPFQGSSYWAIQGHFKDVARANFHLEVKPQVKLLNHKDFH